MKEEWVTARRPHSCDECLQTIDRCETHQLLRDGSRTWRICALCARRREDVLARQGSESFIPTATQVGNLKRLLATRKYSDL